MKDIYTLLRSLEEENNLFSIEARGVSLWRLFRSDVWLALLGFRYAHTQAKRISRLRAMLADARHDVAHMPKAASLLFVSYASFHVPEQGLFTDPLLDAACMSSGAVKLLSPTRNAVPGALKVPAALSMALPDLAASLGSRLLPPGRQAKAAAKALTETLKGLPQLASMTEERILHSLHVFFLQRAAYVHLLRRLSPKLIVVGNPQTIPIIAAARHLRIPVLERQHGVCNRFHPDLIPASAAVYGDSLLPHNGFLLFGNYWKREIEKGESVYTPDSLFPIGHYSADIWRKRASRSPEKATRIVATLPGSGDQRIIDLLAAFMELRGARDLCKLTIKLHPRYSAPAEAYSRLNAAGGDRGKNVRLVGGPDAPSSWELLSEADLHISTISACHYEALAMGVPSIMLASEFEETLPDLLEGDIVPRIETPEALLTMIRDRSWNPVSERESHDLCTPGFAVNLRNVLSRYGAA